MVKKNLKATQDRNMSYTDRNRLFKEFQVGEQVYLRIKIKKISLWIGSCAKMAPRFYGPFSIIERIGLVAYQIAFPSTVKVQDFLHVSLLKKYVKDDDHVID